MEAKVLKNMQGIKRVLQDDYKNNLVPKKDVEDIAESINEIKEARPKNRMNGGEMTSIQEKCMKGGRLPSRAILKTCFYIFISVIAA